MAAVASSSLLFIEADLPAVINSMLTSPVSGSVADLRVAEFMSSIDCKTSCLVTSRESLILAKA